MSNAVNPFLPRTATGPRMKKGRVEEYKRCPQIDKPHYQDASCARNGIKIIWANAHKFAF